MRWLSSKRQASVEPEMKSEGQQQRGGGNLPPQNDRDTNGSPPTAAGGGGGLQHELEIGDHVFRWSNIILYPIQIHGIVLSVQPTKITLIDFGLTSSNCTQLPSNTSDDNTIHLDDWEDPDNRRLNIVTLTEQTEVKKWRKVNYGESIVSEQKWAKITRWFRRKSASKPDEAVRNCTSAKEEISTTSDAYDLHRSRNSFTESSDSLPAAPLSPDEAGSRRQLQEFLVWWKKEEKEDNDQEAIVPASRPSPGSSKKKETIATETGEKSTEGIQKDAGQAAKATSTTTDAPRIPKSDPAMIVLSRVRFLLGEDGREALPPHHVLFANSECIAVWCKTGRFSTIQSQIFLHSTALGNAKTATTVALIVGSQTVAVSSTIPAAGLWGWLGYTTTTTTQVGLLSMNPWLIPIMAGTGLAAVGTPYLILHRAQTKWNQATEILNDVFWQNATPDIYVDAIRHWAGMGRDEGTSRAGTRRSPERVESNTGMTRN